VSGPLAGRVAIVTGAATGIGRGIARRLAADGAVVAINHLDTAAAAEALCAEIVAAGGTALIAQADVGRRAELERVFATVLERFGRIDILVNNAALALLRPIAEATEREIDTMLAVNVKGMLWGCQLAVEHIVDGGRIVNISSSTTGLALPGYGIYDMTKGAMEQVTRILAREVGSRAITVNAVAPGATETETYRIGKSDEFLASLERMSAFGRLGRVNEIADVVAFVASDAARWVTGQVIRVNGGTV
jgi:3-oxoacyl-[acyl-carrier protein] reductase